eukprot:scaffold136541_cov28-Tisochrysis_lutea.AAC.1
MARAHCNPVLSWQLKQPCDQSYAAPSDLPPVCPIRTVIEGTHDHTSAWQSRVQPSDLPRDASSSL